MVGILGRIVGCGDKYEARLTKAGWIILANLFWFIIGVSILVSCYLGDAIRLFWEMGLVSRVAIMFFLPSLVMFAIIIWSMLLFNLSLYKTYRVGGRDG